MKWFKHYTKALSDAKIEKLIMKFGIEGYGLYFACLEIIAGNLSDENITFELEHDSEILAYKFKIDTIKIEEMMKYMVHLELFEINEITNKVTCLKLAKNLDSSLIKNPNLLQLKKNIQENSRKVEIMQEKSSQIRLDKIRLDKNRKEKIIICENFEEWWIAYDKKRNKTNTIKEWNKLNVDVDLFTKIMQHTFQFIRSTEKQFRPDPERYLKNKRFEDEIIIKESNKGYNDPEIHKQLDAIK